MKCAGKASNGWPLACVLLVIGMLGVLGLGVAEAGEPTVTTNTATNVTATSATLRGSINPNGVSTFGHFLWGTTNPPTQQSGTQWIGSGTAAVAYSQDVGVPTRLTPNTTYYFQAVGVGNTTVKGTVRSFTTAAAVPTVTTNTATNVTATSATLRGNTRGAGCWGTMGTRNAVR